MGTPEGAHQDRPDRHLPLVATMLSPCPVDGKRKMTSAEAAISAEEITGAPKAALLHAAGMTGGAIAELVSMIAGAQAPRNAWLMLFELYRYQRKQAEHDALAQCFQQARNEKAPSFQPCPKFAVPGVLRVEANRFGLSDLAAIRGHAQGRATVAVDIGGVECLPLELAVALVTLARDLRARGQRLLLMRAPACVAALLDALQGGDATTVAVVCPATPERTPAPAPTAEPALAS
jgi:hypothetical protein